MLITNNEKSITFEQALTLLPQEFSLLNESMDLNIEIRDGRLFLLQDGMSPFALDINKKSLYHKQFFYKHSLYKDPLARALGLKKGQDRPVVVDATAGALNDSILISSYGCRVIALERSPLVAAIIINALNFADSEFLDGFTFSYGEYDGSEIADVVYYDPMYGDKNEKAAPKKEMQIFRTIVEADSDCHEVAQKLLSYHKRLVIKRSIKAPNILDNPDHSIKGKSTRYDVYLSTKP